MESVTVCAVCMQSLFVSSGIMKCILTSTMSTQNPTSLKTHCAGIGALCAGHWCIGALHLCIALWHCCGVHCVAGRCIGALCRVHWALRFGALCSALCIMHCLGAFVKHAWRIALQQTAEHNDSGVHHEEHPEELHDESGTAVHGAVVCCRLGSFVVYCLQWSSTGTTGNSRTSRQESQVATRGLVGSRLRPFTMVVQLEIVTH